MVTPEDEEGTNVIQSVTEESLVDDGLGMSDRTTAVDFNALSEALSSDVQEMSHRSSSNRSGQTGCSKGDKQASKRSCTWKGSTNIGIPKGKPTLLEKVIIVFITVS